MGKIIENLLIHTVWNIVLGFVPHRLKQNSTVSNIMQYIIIEETAMFGEMHCLTT